MKYALYEIGSDLQIENAVPSSKDWFKVSCIAAESDTKNVPWIIRVTRWEQ